MKSILNRRNFFAVLVALMVMCITAGVANCGTYSGGTGEPNDPYLISTPNDLNSIGIDSNDWNKHFLMTADINMADYSYTMAVIAPDTNSSVMGFQGTPFTGTFDGNNYTIYSLKIDSNLPHSDYLGLFGQTDGNAVIENLIIKKVHITGGDYSHYLGGLCGQITEGTLIRNINIEDVNINVAEWSFYIGGIVGRILDGIISDCYVSGIMSSGDNSRYIGGLCGQNLKYGIIRECHSRCSVTGRRTYYIGGLCGTNYGTISKCYSSSSVNGYYLSLQFGGFCGNNRGTISNCYSTGPVTGFYNTHWAGGFCGGNSHGGIISNSYSSGFVTGYYYVGGFCAGNWQSYSNNCYWDVNTSGQLSSVGGGIGLPTEEMQTFDTYLKAGWDFTTPIWTIDEGNDYPRLCWETSCGLGNIAPVVCIVGGDMTIEVGSGCEARITLDGSCSSDADSTEGTNDDINDFDWYEVIDACEPNSDIYIGSGEVIECNLGLGEHLITLEVTDKAGAFDSNEVVITVEDVTPPEFSLSVSPDVLWPANHKMVLITPTMTVNDNCDEDPNVSLVSITMNEEDDAKGDGHTSDDIQVNADGIWLRAERSGTGTGRIYTITYQAVDDSGNVTVQDAIVTVPHDRR